MLLQKETLRCLHGNSWDQRRDQRHTDVGFFPFFGFVLFCFVFVPY